MARVTAGHQRCSGARERTIEAKIADVQRQLERGEALIVFAVATATTNIVPARGAGV